MPTLQQFIHRRRTEAERSFTGLAALSLERTTSETRAAQASIGTCPGSAATRSSHARIAGYGARSNPPSCGDVRVGVERDVGDRHRLADEQLARAARCRSITSSAR